MKDIEKLIENFFSKKENIISEQQLKEYVEKQFLLEAQKTFNVQQMIEYYNDWVEQVKAGKPFLVLDNGEKKGVIVDPSFVNTLISIGGNYLVAKDLFAPGGSYVNIIPSTDGKKYKLSQFTKETFTGKVGAAGDIKEGLVAYFYGLLESSSGKKQINNLVTVLTTDKKIKISLPTEISTENILVGTSASMIVNEIEQINSGLINAKNSNLFLNAISSALAMNEILKSSSDIIVDKALTYNKIRNVASNITAGEPNKWNPADVFLYKRSFLPTIEKVLTEAERTKSIVTTTVEKKLDQVGLNELFSESAKDKIYAISLKEERAQHGKGLIFAKHASAVLKNSDIKIYKTESKELLRALESGQASGDDKSISEWTKKLNDQKKLALAALKQVGVVQLQLTDLSIAESIDNIPIVEEIRLMFEAGLKFANLIDPKYKENFLNKISKQEPFTLLSGETVILDPEILPNLKAAGTNTEKIKSLFRAGFPTIDKQRVINVGSLDASSLASKTPAVLPSKPAVNKSFVKNVDDNQTAILVRTIKKYECYKFLQMYIDQFDKIKKINTVMSRYANPLIALTAYAVGLSGFNPTFFKVQGASDGSMGKITKFEGQDRLVMTANKATLEDFNNYAGIKLIFVSEMGISDEGKPKLFNTSLNFKFKGNAEITVEVYEFKEK